MNKTKRKIFETSMKLFAEKGYDATSIEDITATVGVAKGTLYYHFNSKEEIFDFLLEEGIKLLQNSVDIKTAKYSNYLDKIKAIILIQIKIVNKYEDLINIILTQLWGKEKRNIKCQKLIYEYIDKIETIVNEGIKLGQIKNGDAKIIASEIYGLISSTLVFKMKEQKKFLLELSNFVSAKTLFFSEKIFLLCSKLSNRKYEVFLSNSLYILNNDFFDNDDFLAK